MRTNQPDVARRRGLRLGVLSVVAAVLVALALPVPSAVAKKGSCGRASGCNRYELIHAGATYDWYPAAIRHEFKTSAGPRPPKVFSVAGSPSTWRDLHGTLLTEATHGNVVTDWNQARARGRWEVRFRSRSGSWRQPDGRPYAVKVELVPASAPSACAPRSIVMASYNQGGSRRVATVGVRNGAFRAAAPVRAAGPIYDVRKWNNAQSKKRGAWRVWAVEVTRNHISWFLDGRIVKRENRPAALLGQQLHLRISLLGGAGMAPTATQLDWARYWSLKRTTKAKKKVRQLRRAPALVAGRNPTPGC